MRRSDPESALPKPTLDETRSPLPIELFDSNINPELDANAIFNIFKEKSDELKEFIKKNHVKSFRPKDLRERESGFKRLKPQSYPEINSEIASVNLSNTGENPNDTSKTIDPVLHLALKEKDLFFIILNNLYFQGCRVDFVIGLLNDTQINNLIYDLQFCNIDSIKFRPIKFEEGGDLIDIETDEELKTYCDNLVKFIKSNNKITSLDLRNNGIMDKDIVPIIEAFIENDLLQHLYVDGNGSESLIAILLKTNSQTLESMFLGDNSTNEGEDEDLSQTIFFRNNNSIKTLQLGDNNFEIENLKTIFNQIAENKTIKNLKLNSLKVFNDAIDEFCNILKSNNAIEKLDISLNPIKPENYSKIVNSLENNFNITSLEYSLDEQTNTEIKTILNRNQVLKQAFGDLEYSEYKAVIDNLYEIQVDDTQLKTLMNKYSFLFERINSLNKTLPEKHKISDEKLELIKGCNTTGGNSVKHPEAQPLSKKARISQDF